MIQRQPGTTHATEERDASNDLWPVTRRGPLRSDTVMESRTAEPMRINEPTLNSAIITNVYKEKCSQSSTGKFRSLGLELVKSCRRSEEARARALALRARVRECGELE